MMNLYKRLQRTQTKLGKEHSKIPKTRQGTQLQYLTKLTLTQTIAKRLRHYWSFHSMEFENVVKKKKTKLSHLRR